MLNFGEITPEDGRWARPLLLGSEFSSCEFAFVNIYMWKKVYNTQIARFKDFVVARSEGKRLHYLFPAGKGDLKEVLDAILADAEAIGKEPVIFSLNEEMKSNVEQLYPGTFLFTQPLGESDYIYLSSDLAELAGKKFQKKRNHCARFERENPDWKFFEISDDSIEKVCKFNNIWCNLYDNRGDEGIAEEHIAIAQVCRHYDELHLKGGYIEVGGEVVAFSFGSPLNKDMFVTHVEKALYNITGAYNIINREMARRFCQNYKYINRENDLDEEGLRKAKHSYNPVLMEHTYVAELASAEG